MRRITVNVADETNENLDFWCHKLGLAKTQLAGLSIEAGFSQILRAISPLDSLDKKQLAKLFEALEIAGVEVKRDKVEDYEEKMQ